MPKISSKPDKTMYMTVREELALTRERASALICRQCISADRLEKIENRLDLQKTQLVNHHVERLMENGCEPFAGIIFTNLVSDLERLGDHAENIAFSLTDEDPN